MGGGYNLAPAFFKAAAHFKPYSLFQTHAARIVSASWRGCTPPSRCKLGNAAQYLRPLDTHKCCYLQYMQPVATQKCRYSQYLQTLATQKCCDKQYFRLCKRRNVSICSTRSRTKNQGRATPLQGKHGRALCNKNLRSCMKLGSTRKDLLLPQLRTSNLSKFQISKCFENLKV